MVYESYYGSYPNKVHTFHRLQASGHELKDLHSSGKPIHTPTSLWIVFSTFLVSEMTEPTSANDDHVEGVLRPNAVYIGVRFDASPDLGEVRNITPGIGIAKKRHDGRMKRSDHQLDHEKVIRYTLSGDPSTLNYQLRLPILLL